MSMLQISKKLGVSIDAVTYFMRKHNLKRRSFSEIQKKRFNSKRASFKLKMGAGIELKAIGSMLYWGEGYKGTRDKPANLVDFANSDPYMIELFLLFIRKCFSIDESKLRVLLYCYDDQNTISLINFWSKLTKIPKSNFTKPYIKDNQSSNRKMNYGLVHIRYYDKKLLLEILKMIDSYKVSYLRRSDSGYSSGL